MFEKCNNCGTRLITGRRDQNGIFCSTACQNFYRCPGFCQWCDAGTTPKSAGSTYTMNGIGTTMYGSKDPCPNCGSVIKRKWLVVFFIPIIPIGSYRFKWVTRGRYISRKLKPAGDPSSAPNWLVSHNQPRWPNPKAFVTVECLSIALECLRFSYIISRIEYPSPRAVCTHARFAARKLNISVIDISRLDEPSKRRRRFALTIIFAIRCYLG